MNTSRSRFQPAIRSLIIAIALLTLAGGVRAATWKEKVLYSFQGLPDGATPAGGVVFDQSGNLYGATTDGGANNCLGIAQCGIVYQLQPPTTKGKPWTESILYVFQGVNSNDGNTPAGGVVFDKTGHLYGTTAYGGSGGCQLFGSRVGCGTVFELVPPRQTGGAWTEKVLHSFQSGKDGYFPWGDLTFDSAGNLYGATQYGGGKGTTCDSFYQFCGTVFKLSPPKTKGGKWSEKVLYSFKGVQAGKQFGDGANPNGGLVFDDKGAIYGTTYFGGNNVQGQCQGGSGGTGCGIVFKLIPPSGKGGKWKELLLHRFNGEDGSNSAAGVVLDVSGNLYGTTSFGPGPYGLIFELKKPSGKVHSWAETTLHLFTDGYDGSVPRAGLAFGTDGDLYGTASAGGNIGGGDVLRLKSPSGKSGRWVVSVLHGFAGHPDGANPAASVVFDGVGAIYSTTQIGGTGTGCQYGGCGTVFQISP